MTKSIWNHSDLLFLFSPENVN